MKFRRVVLKSFALLLTAVVLFGSFSSCKTETAPVRLQDDFYTAINQDWIDSSKIPDGVASWSSFSEVEQKITYQILGMIQDLTKDSSGLAPGTDSYNIAVLFEQSMDWGKRDKQGAQPIQKYLDLVDEAKTPQQLIEAMAHLDTMITTGLLMDVLPDPKNSSVNILSLNGLLTKLPQEYYLGGKQKNIVENYLNYLSGLFQLTGEQKLSADAYARTVWQFESQIAINSLSREAMTNPNELYHVFTTDELDYYLGNLNIGYYFKTIGAGKPIAILVQQPALLDWFNNIFCEENLAVLKLYIKSNILAACATYLSRDFYDTAAQFSSILYGTTGTLSDEEIAFKTVNRQLPFPVGEMYVEKHFSTEGKEDVTNLIKNIIEEYKLRIGESTWLSQETKLKAVEKLDAIHIKVGYPDFRPSYYDKIQLKTTETSLFDNIMHIRYLASRSELHTIGDTVEKRRWFISPQTVNAYYDPSRNDIVFPAGILQYPFYEYGRNEEANLGGIGAIIAHEITHAFDATGCRFDKNGNLNDWWTQQDYENFKERSAKLIELFNGVNAGKQATIDGRLTLSENIADLAAMASIIDIAKRRGGNLDMLFENYAVIWRKKSTEQYEAFITSNDVHAPSKYRVNLILPNFIEFYETYGITEKDKMYLAPEKRMQIW